ncbi:hypothetical protein ACETRX_09415 [Labrys portucalensis]|uniref:Uncharacterized protein n=1 Tax=Labrys neptuniae TaxID=376174 RepID=A0ABV6ZC99_9HYPH|nr:hypothetical protein [Labrys neptuniae]MDT3376137.1 hypothetical protein [Labrys neptuniae]
MKTLEDMGSPPGFDGEPDYNAETDEEERKLYESLMLATASGFDEAVAALTAFLQRHIGAELETTTEDVAGVRSWVGRCQTASQSVDAQLTDFGDYRGGYLRLVSDLEGTQS